jgi:UDP-N-acetyl-D-glucosamine dehydrogenase
MNTCEAQILAKLASREAHAAVIGLSYVGLPLAVVFAKAGYCVIGIEQTRIYESVSAGRVPFSVPARC